MGVPKFLVWLRNQPYRNVVQGGYPDRMDNVAIDFNGLIHEAAQLVYAYGEEANPARVERVKTMSESALERELFNLLETDISTIAANLQPNQTLIIAVDGVAPMGKIAQQRSRRYKSVTQVDPKRFHPNMISPGTEFMKRLDKELFRSPKGNDPGGWLQRSAKALAPRVIYSSHLVPGEGEHKIMDMVRKGQITGSLVLYGLDADLVMLGCLAPLEEVFVVREELHPRKRAVPRHTVAIAALRTEIKERLAMPIEDWVALLALIGNDFLPASPAFFDMPSAIESLMDAYAKVNRPLIQGGQVDIYTLSLILHEIPEIELLASLTQTEYKSGAFRILQEAREQDAFYPEYFRSRWYQHTLVASDVERIEYQCQAYLRTIAWVYVYYSAGLASVNPELQYPYHYAPLLGDLSLIAGVYTPSGYLAAAGKGTLPPYAQLLAILPPPSRAILPVPYRVLYEPDSPIADFYPNKWYVEDQATNWEHQHKAILPFVDTDRLMEAFLSVDYKRQPAQDSNKELINSGFLVRISEAQRRAMNEDDERREGERRDRERYERERRETETRYEERRREDRGGYRGRAGASERGRGGYRGRGSARGRGEYRGGRADTRGRGWQESHPLM